MDNSAGMPQILIIDDSRDIVDVLSSILQSDFHTLSATTGIVGLDLAIQNNPDIILLDIMLPDMSGYDVCQKLKSNPTTHNIPVIFMTGLSDYKNEAKGLEIGAVDYITKPFNIDLTRRRILNHLELKLYRDSLEKLVEDKISEVELIKNKIIECISSLAEFRSSETGSHIQRCKIFINILCKSLKNNPKYSDILTDSYIKLVSHVSPMHDIGKIIIPDNILMKPGVLTEAEFVIVKMHTIHGEKIITDIIGDKLKENQYLNVAKQMALTHHEKWDGTGYPNGLSGLNIPLPGRLMAIVDVFEALISKRVYKDPILPEIAINILENESGTAFDPELIEAFSNAKIKFLEIIQKK